MFFQHFNLHTWSILHSQSSRDDFKDFFSPFLVILNVRETQLDWVSSTNSKQFLHRQQFLFVHTAKLTLHNQKKKKNETR